MNILSVPSPGPCYQEPIATQSASKVDRPIKARPLKQVHKKREKNSAARESHKRLLGAIIGLGALIILTSFFFDKRIAARFQFSGIWDVWELAALAWSVFFGVYYYWTYEEIEDRNKRGLQKLLILGMVVAAFLLPAAGIWSLVTYHNTWYHHLAVITTAVLYLLIDLSLSHLHPTNRDDYRESLWLADYPTVIGMAIVILYAWLRQAETGWQAFVCGVIAFQLLVCNVIFIVTQLGKHRPLGV